MSLYDYYKSRGIIDSDPTFEALIMAAAGKAQTVSGIKLKETFPRIVGEFQERCTKGSLGLLDGDEINVKIGGGKFRKIYRSK